MRKFSLLLVLFATAAGAHDVWIEPRTNGATVSLDLKVGEHFVIEESPRFDPARVAGMWITAGEDVRDVSDDTAARRGILEQKAPAMIALERTPFDVTLSAAKFNAYVDEEGHPSGWKRGGTTRERVRRHLKTFLGAPADDAPAFLRTFGTSFELVPLSLPGAGETFAVRVLCDGRPLANARVDAFGRGGRNWKASVRTDSEGIARLTLAERGLILVRATRLAPSSGDVDFESDWASLTFAIR